MFFVNKNNILRDEDFLTVESPGDLAADALENRLSKVSEYNNITYINAI